MKKYDFYNQGDGRVLPGGFKAHWVYHGLVALVSQQAALITQLSNRESSACSHTLRHLMPELSKLGCWWYVDGGIVLKGSIVCEDGRVLNGLGLDDMRGYDQAKLLNTVHNRHLRAARNGSWSYGDMQSCPEEPDLAHVLSHGDKVCPRVCYYRRSRKRWLYGTVYAVSRRFMDNNFSEWERMHGLPPFIKQE